MMETAKKPSFNPAAMSQGHRDRDITDDRYRDLRRPRKVKFFCNGDRYFKGKKVYVTPHRYLGFNDLLNDLTGKLPHSMQLPYGVRQVFSPSSGRKIRDIEELKDGHSYVCGGFEIFKAIRYGAREVEPWSHGKNRLDVLEPIGSSKDPQISGAGGAPGQRAIYGGFQPGRTLRQTYPYGPKRKQPAAFGGRSGPNSQWGQSATEQGANKPKVITVIRNGTKPRTNVKILLNRRSVQSFEYLMKDIADAFGPKWKNNKVRKLFTIKGKEVQGIADFFREDEVFIGLGNEPLTTGDVQDILEEVYPESQHPKTLMREWDKTKKRYAQGARKTEAFTEESKLDSGLGSDASKEGNDQASEVIYQPKPQDETRKKKKRKDKIHVVATEAVPEDEDLVEQVERERLRASEEEKEKARKRMQKRLDLEKRVLDDEKRKKNLVPPKQSGNDPFKQIQEDREREVEKDREREKQRLLELEEQKLTDEQSRVKAEERNKARKDIEKQREVEIGEKVMKDKEKRRTRSKERQTPQPKETDLLSAKDSDSAKKRDESGERSRTSKSKEREKVKEKEKDKERDKEIKSTTKDSPRKPAENKKDSEKPVDKDEAKIDKNVKSEVTPTNSGKPESDSKPVVDKNDNVTTEEPSVPKPQPADNKDGKKDETNKESNKENDEKKKDQDKDDKSKKKRSKTIIHKTKLERQISNTEHVLEKYEAGKVLGDGNFAIVKSAKLRNTNKEFAMKIIDKSKLKGKEQMIENEIALMKMCSQPNIVKLYEEFETKAEIYLIMELVKGGDLFDAITQSVKFGEPDSAGMVADLTNALFYLHSRSVVHRDLKPENLLVQRNKDSSITLKLADFGLAMEVKEPIYTVCGTPTYVAPEILCETGYGLEVDMWAVGVISYILLCGFPPFRSPDRNQTELFEFIKAGEYEFLSPYWDKVSRASKDLISRLLIVDKRKRYNAIDVLCHPWVITRGGTLRPAEPMDEHRKNLRKELEQQARQNRESFLNQKLGQA